MDDLMLHDGTDQLLLQFDFNGSSATRPIDVPDLSLPASPSKVAPLPRCSGDWVGVPAVRDFNAQERAVLTAALEDAAGELPTSTGFPLTVTNLRALLDCDWISSDTVDHLAAMNVAALSTAVENVRNFYLNSSFLLSLEAGKLTDGGLNILGGEVLFDGVGEPCFDHIFTTFSDDSHWYVVDIDAAEKRINFLDSMAQSKPVMRRFGKLLAEWLNDYCFRDTDGQLGCDEFEYGTYAAPCQTDTWSCGRFAVYFIRCRMVGQPLTMVLPQAMGFYSTQLALDAITHVLNYRVTHPSVSGVPLLSQITVDDDGALTAVQPVTDHSHAPASSLATAATLSSTTAPFRMDSTLSLNLPASLFSGKKLRLEDCRARIQSFEKLDRCNAVMIAMYFHDNTILNDLALFIQREGLQWHGLRKDTAVKLIRAKINSTIGDDRIVVRKHGNMRHTHLRPDNERLFVCNNEAECESMNNLEKGAYARWSLTEIGRRAVEKLLHSDTTSTGFRPMAGVRGGYPTYTAQLAEIFAAYGALTIEETVEIYCKLHTTDAEALRPILSDVLRVQTTAFGKYPRFAAYHGFWFDRKHYAEALAKRWISTEHQAMGLQILRPLVANELVGHQRPKVDAGVCIPLLIPRLHEESWFAVAPSNIPGAELGGFAKRDIPRGIYIEVIGEDRVNDTQDDARMEYAFGYTDRLTSQRRFIDPHSGGHVTCIAGRFNHAAAPQAQVAAFAVFDVEKNCERIYLEFQRDVACGEEIFLDYGPVYWEGTTFALPESAKRKSCEDDSAEFGTAKRRCATHIELPSPLEEVSYSPMSYLI